MDFFVYHVCEDFINIEIVKIKVVPFPGSVKIEVVPFPGS